MSILALHRLRWTLVWVRDHFGVRLDRVSATSRSELNEHERDNRTATEPGQPGAPDRVARPVALAGAVCAVRRRADDRARRDDRERCPALDPARPGLLRRWSGLGGERLPDRLRRRAAAGRAARRPGRPAARLPGRPGRFHGRVTGLRAGSRPDGAGDGTVRAGSGRRTDLGRRARHDRRDVPRAAGPGQGARCLRLRRLGRRLDRPAGRRRADLGDQLALDLLHQPAGGHRHRGAGSPAGRGRARRRPATRGRRRGRGPADRRPDARGVDHPAGVLGRLDLCVARSGSALSPWRCSSPS